jgi:hypothetical protein
MNARRREKKKAETFIVLNYRFDECSKDLLFLRIPVDDIKGTLIVENYL